MSAVSCKIAVLGGIMTLYQAEPLAYIAGASVGDAWCSDLSVGLRVKDHEFSVAFAWAMADAFGVFTRPKRDERGYWLVRYGNKSARFDSMRTYAPGSEGQRRAWLRGLFDSEGNANLVRQPKLSENAYTRRVSFYSTNEATLARAANYLNADGMETVTLPVKPSRGHKGTKQVFQLRLRHSRDAFLHFANVIGSTISRKQRVLDAIPESYRKDISDSHRAGQAKGAAVRRARRDAGGVY